MDRVSSFPNLEPGSRVAVIGGGPAGSFFVLHLMKCAQAAGLTLDVTLFERKTFHLAGPPGCNMCAGILSSRVVRGLQDLGLTIPPAAIMGRLHRYVLHWHQSRIAIEQPDASRQILSVFRGAGPRAGALPPEASFDAFLLSQAEAAGASLVPERVLEVAFSPGGPAMLRTATRQSPFDLVVFAGGVNTHPPAFLGLAYRGLAYRPPPTATMAQDEIRLHQPADPGTVHIYCDEPPALIFGGLVPKGEYISVSLLGNGLPGHSLERFLAALRERGILEDEPERLCGCRPHIATGPAAGFYADRFVAVGDAAVTRLYKDGIGSALRTAQCAASVVVERGIAGRDFEEHYRPVVQAIEDDNRYGRWLFGAWQYIKGAGFLSRLGERTLLAEQQMAHSVHGALLWSLFTGDESYRHIMAGFLSWPSLRDFARATRRPAPKDR
jgi:flavin-dependent dehydrogenase